MLIDMELTAQFVTGYTQTNKSWNIRQTSKLTVEKNLKDDKFVTTLKTI